MQIAFSTGSLYTYGIERVLRLAAEAGFEAVEVLIDNRWDTRQSGFLAQVAARYGLTIVTLHTPFEPRIDGWERGQLSQLLRTADLAHELGVRVLVAHLPMRWAELFATVSEPPRSLYLPLLWPRELSYRRWLLRDLPAFEKETGLSVGVENMPLSGRWLWPLNRFSLNDGPEFDGHIQRFPHLTMDTTHLATWGANMMAFYERAKARIVNIHLSNYARGKEHRLPWDGVLPLDSLVAKLYADGYAGNLVVELAPDALGAGNDAQVAENLAEAARFCDQRSRPGS